MFKNKEAIQRLAGTAILAALVLLLQFFVIIPVGAFNITLTLVPIIIGGILFGASSGAFLGLVFGAAVAFQVISGSAGALSTFMFQDQPVITISVCLLKGVLAGFVSGLIYGAFKKSNSTKLGVTFSAISCPIINTGIFVCALYIFYSALIDDFIVTNNLINAYADMTSFVFVGIVGLNFVVEFAVNVLMIPVILQIMRAINPKFFQK